MMGGHRILWWEHSARDIGMVRAMKKRHCFMVRAKDKKITIRSSLNEQWYSWSNMTIEVWKIFSIQKKSCSWIKLSNSKSVWLPFLSIHSIVWIWLIDQVPFKKEELQTKLFTPDWFRLPYMINPRICMRMILLNLSLWNEGGEG